MLAMLVTAIAAGLVMLAMTSARQPDRLLRAEVQEELEHLTEGLRTDAAGNLEVVLKPQNATYDAMTKDSAYVLADAAGNTVLQSSPGPALDALKALPSGVDGMTVTSNGIATRLYVMEAPVNHRGQQYTARVARSERLVETLSEYAGRLYLRAAVVTLVLALLTFTIAVYWTIRRMIRPLREASAVAAQVGPRNLGTRLRTENLPTEVIPLIDAFNAALARLENGFRVQQEFLASAAHELKTPLSLLTAEIELSGATNRDVLLQDARHMARQIHQLLHLAEVSEAHNYSFEPVRLAQIIQDAVDYLIRVSGQRAVRVDVHDQVGNVPLLADASAVFVLAKNLVENAIHHAPAGGQVRIDVFPGGFCVQDDGPGVAPAHQPLLFKRFWRANPKDITGAGLGLAICMEICTSHGWRLRYEAAHDGGARFVVETSAAAASPKGRAG
ncbi:sensor histidine kinase [Stenotrophomonas sp. LGBM10]|uniref:sensor histidine kinase n=1 Tax=Stenotrophomonas sp. LGBM10 TaxID=3390038 RepID=UPI00398B4ED8